jgi:Lipase (class 3)
MIDRRKLIETAIGAVALFAPNSFAVAQSPQKATRLVLLHGRSQQGRKSSDIQTEWLSALKLGLEKNGLSLPSQLDVTLPFYGDALDDFARRLNIPLTTEVRARGATPNNEFLAFQEQVADELRRQAGITDHQLDGEYGPNPRPRGPLNHEWVLAILRALDKYGPGMSQGTLELFTRDVYLYTHHQGVRDEIDRIVRAAFTDLPTVVIGHSLGSIVAYNILRSDRRTSGVRKLITVGSPLGIRAIRNQLRPLRFPSVVKSWYNVFDSRDLVALYPLDNDNFPVQPEIENYGRVDNHTDNRHGIVGYLDDAVVAKKILDSF